MDEVKCSGTENNLWDCKKPKVTRCEANNYVTVKCSDRVKVELEFSCYGNIYVRRNGTRHYVCTDGMTEEAQQRMGEVVCQQLNCGKLLTISWGSQVQNGLLKKEDCSGQEDSLWECLATFGLGRCQSTARVSCKVFESMTLEDGLGKCSGRLQVKFEGSQRTVSATGWTEKNSDVVCEQLNCGKSHNAQVNLFVGSNHNQLQWNLKCSDGVSKLSQCTWTQRKDSGKTNVNIICEKEKLWFLQGNSSCEGEVKVESAGKIIQVNKMTTDVCEWLHCGTVNCSATTALHANCSRENATTQNTTTTDHVKCSGSVEVRLENKEKEKCWGKVKVCMNGNCGGVCSDTWTKNLSDMLCENQSCGKALSKEYRGSTEPGLTTGSVHCSQETRKLSHCYFALMSDQSTCQTPVHVSCTGSVKAKLNDPRDKCAGRLELFYLGKWQPVCADGVSQETQTNICRSLKCGDDINFTKYEASKAEGLSGITCQYLSNNFTCDFSKTKIQECLTGHLNCSGWRRLLLTDPDNACAGKVYEQDHNGLIAVSKEHWGPDQGEELCKYLKCGKFSNYGGNNQPNEERNRAYKCNGTQKILDCEVDNKTAQLQHLSINCDDISSPPGPLKPRWRRNTSAARATRTEKVLSVACANSIEFKFTEKCGGELQVRYRGNWEPVCLNSIDDAHVICRNQNCGKATGFENLYSREQVQTSFKCEDEETDPKSCIKYESCQQRKAIIYCEKYASMVGLTVGLVVGLLFLLVAIVIVIWQRKRFLTILRLNPSAGDKDVELSSKEMQDLNENSKDDYEDVDLITNPMEDESESQEGESEDEEQSSSGGSSRTQYDDVEESSHRKQEPENSSPAAPLLPPRPANLHDDESYDAELEDYDDAMPAQSAVSETGESPDSSENRIALRGPDSPCEGRLEVQNAGEWGLVCYHGWNSENGQDHKNGEVVCRSLGCGQHVESGHNKDRYSHPPKTTKYWMDEVKCSGTENNLWDCKKPKVTRCEADNYVTVKCSGSIQLSLNRNGKMDECAGVVQFKTPNGYVGVCNNEWDKDKADMVCKELKCGKHYKIPQFGTFQREEQYSVPLHCIGNENFSWQCVNWVEAKSSKCSQEASVVICSNHKSIRLRSDDGDVCNGTLQQKNSIENSNWVSVQYPKGGYRTAEADDICSKLNCGKSSNVTQCKGSEICLTCTDRVKVELEFSCYGNIYVRLNGTRHYVCTNGMTEEAQQRMGEVVCQQLNCGKLLTISRGSKVQNGLLKKVDCSGQEDSLWECLATFGLGRCQSTARVSCKVFESMTLEDGLGKCSGRLQVKFEGSQRTVSATGWTETNSDVVCEQLNCGKSHNTQENLFVGSNHNQLQWNLKCSDGVSKLSQCTWTQRKDSGKTNVNIICEKEKLWFLQGNSSCEGEVKVESAGKIIQVNKMTTDVCEWLHCGTVNCSATTALHANCSRENATTQNTTTTDHVKCSGSVEVRLENGEKEKCWGKVKVCMKDTCGGVCSNTWTKNLSDMLCENQGCGNAFSKEYRGSTELGLTIGSVHCSQETRNLNQCYFALMSDQSTCQTPVHVSCTGSVKAKLNDPRDKCAGRLELFYLGKWQPVCADGVSQETQTNICRSLKCGDAINFNKYEASKAEGLSGITCQYLSNNFTCDFSKTKIQECLTGHLNCSGWRRLLLTDPDNACVGKVYARDRNGLIAVSKEHWGPDQGKELCKYLKCGKFSNYGGNNQPNEERNRAYKCNGTQKILDCEVDNKTAQLQHLRINCNGNPEVNLLGNCTGEVRVNQSERMCGVLQNTDRVLNELCHHLNCRHLITYWATKAKVEAQYFSCTGHENRLWQCSSWKESCDTVISVACANSVEFSFTGKCGGELQVRYRGNWEPVCLNSIEDAHVICRNQNCGKATGYENSTSRERVQTSFKCEKGETDPKSCVKYQPCQEGKAIIYCENSIEFNFTGKCGGELQVRYRGNWEPVCLNSIEDAHVICRDQNCGKATGFENSTSRERVQTSFMCEKGETDPKSCIKYQPCQEGKAIIYCENSIEFNFTGKCGGELQVRYRGNWEPVCLNSTEDAHVICRNQNCGKAMEFSASSEQAQTSFMCEKGETDPKSCVKYQPCQEGKAIIYCEKHVPVVEVVPPNTGLIVGLLVGLLFLLVAIVIVIWQRKRFLAILRLKHSAGDKDIELSSNEMQDIHENKDLYDRKSSMFEIDDYEDVDLITNPMEDESESQGESKDEEHSLSGGSSRTQYDDVEESSHRKQEPENSSPAAPLLPQRPANLHVEGEDEEKSSSGGSSRTQYDDVEESSDRAQEPENSSLAAPLLPPRPANLHDDVSYKAELDVLEDYDDAMPAQAAVNETEESPGSETSEESDMLVGPDD
ncbi:hypothetical protein MHYP_G00326790 [Metynnis hypsauchen]